MSMHKKVFIFLFQLVIFCMLCNQYCFGKSIRTADNKLGSFSRYPFIVSLLVSDNRYTLQENIFCTGTYITTNHILTCEHCFDSIGQYALVIMVGTDDLYRGTQLPAMWMISYDQWATSNNVNLDYEDNDVAIIKTIYGINSDWITATVSGLTPDSVLYGLVAEIPGWGETNSGVSLRHLQTGNVTILSNRQCADRTARIRGYAVMMPATFLCSTANPYVLLADGDSGGPLLYQNTILAVNKGTCPKDDQNSFNNRKVNIHVSITYYRYFIQMMLYM